MRHQEIRSWTKQIIESFGKPKRDIDERPLRAFYEQANYGAMLTHIRDSMQLDVRLRIGYVESGGRKDSIAWVILPSPMPPFGSKELKETRITVYVRKSTIRDSPFEILVSVLAHEMSHILLDSVGHRLRRQEEAVDLTAMLFGYSRFFLVERMLYREVPRENLLAKAYKWISGKELTTEELSFSIHTSGYMSADEITFAQSLMRV